MNTQLNLAIVKPLDILYLFLLATFPLALIIGNFIINLYILFFSISFFINFRENKVILKDKYFYLLIFFFISLLINLFFSSNVENSFPRIIKLIFVIFFIFEIKRLIQKYALNYIQNVYKSWFLIFLILTVDIIFELSFGYNLIGNKSYMHNRVASFFGDELIAGAFYHGFVLFFFSYLVLRRSRNYMLIFSIILVLLISFFIGERSNFIKLFISLTIFSSLIIKINNKLKLLTVSSVIIVLIAALNLSDEGYKDKYFEQIKIIATSDGYLKFIKRTQYGAHRDVSMKIFKENLFFGVGVKNFRHESGKKKYENNEFLQTNKRQSTHPHQIHHEFLSETGLFGYFSFLIFLLSSIFLSLKSYLKDKNIYQLSSIIFIITSMLPILPSGSFLSTFTSGIFWLNFAVMISYVKVKS
jgi:O-antigen ligase